MYYAINTTRFNLYMYLNGIHIFFILALSTITGSIVYGLMCQDREWMPNPQFNFLSWGFGFYIISGIASIAAGVTFFIEAQRAYNELISREVVLAKNIMETVGWVPGEVGQPQEASYEGGFVDPSYRQQPYNPQYGVPARS